MTVMGDFLAQQLPVTLTQPVERLLHRVLSHAQFLRSVYLRRTIWFVGRATSVSSQIIRQLPDQRQRYSSPNRLITCSSNANAQRRS